jgi:hypothetical protein
MSDQVIQWRYYSVTASVAAPAHDYIHGELAHRDAYWAHRHGSARVCYLLATPLDVGTRVVDTAIGLAAGVGSLITLGTSRELNGFATRHLHSSNTLIAAPFKCLVRFINPQAPFAGASRDGPVGVRVGNLTRRWCGALARHNNCFVRHVVSRLGYALRTLAMIISRVIDLIIGAIAAIGSLLTLGCFERINSIAYRGLTGVGMIQDIFYGLRKMINPRNIIDAD